MVDKLGSQPLICATVPGERCGPGERKEEVKARREAGRGRGCRRDRERFPTRLHEDKNQVCLTHPRPGKQLAHSKQRTFID
jgi:hypothetical protein